jgi:hypothetical protein
VRNPFQSETEAFRFLLATVAAFAAIAAASLLGGAWVGVPVCALLTVGATTFFLLRRRGARGLRTAPPHLGGPSERRLLVLVDGVAADEATAHEIRRASSGYRTQVLVVCPARVSGLDRWASAVDTARADARRYLDESLAWLRQQGIEARGAIGDEHLVCAIEDTLRTFPADEIIIATLPEHAGATGGLDTVAGAREHFAIQITHVVVNTDTGLVARR